jgi:hypothetical protein
MDKKFVDSISKAWQEVYEKKTLDPVDHDELKGKHKDRKDKDIDNDGDVDSSDEYLHKKRKAISKAIKKEEVDESSCGTVNASKKTKNEDDQEMDTEEPMSKDGMKKCKECGGSSENHDEECSQYASSEKTKASAKKEAIRHEVYGYGEIITETDNGFDILFAHGVEFNVPAEQCEGVSSAIKTAKKMSGNMTGAYKKIDKMKKGLADNPRVQKALKKANEEEEVKEGTVAELDRTVSETYSSIQQQVISAMRSMWEGSGAVADKKAKTDSKGQPADDQDDNLKGKGAVDMAKDIDAEGADSPKIPKGGDDEVGHDDASKAGRVTKAAPKRPADQTIGDKSIVNPVKKS